MNKHLSSLSKSELIALVESGKEQLGRLEKDNGSLSQQVDWLNHQLAQLRKLIFGAKRERFIPAEGQLSLPFEVDQKTEEAPPEKEVSYKRSTPAREKHPGRQALPSHLRVEETIIEPDNLPEGSVKIGEEITDVLEYKPCELYIERTIRLKYSLPENGVAIATLPARPIEKCMAGTGLLAQLLVDKFVDHLPIYRQRQRYKRLDVNLSASTLNSWQESVCKLLLPLYETLQHHILSEGYLQVDETPIRVLDKEKSKGKSHQGYYWVYHSPIRKAVLFDYRKGRSREGPKEMLQDFTGYLQTDGYKVYDWFATRPGITMVGCMAHARRYFEQTLDNDKTRAEHVLKLIQQLYAIERRAHELTAGQRHSLRLDEALPILNQIGKYIAAEFKKVLPKSAIGKAMAYSIARWGHLLNYLKDGHLAIDNNGVENAIRPNALGRKNYLFAGSHNGTQRAAMMYSFFGTCKMNNIDPYQWIKEILQQIPETKISQLNQLLPYNFKTN